MRVVEVVATVDVVGDDVTLDWSCDVVEVVMGALEVTCDAETWRGVRVAPEKREATAILFSSAAWLLNCFTD